MRKTKIFIAIGIGIILVLGGFLVLFNKNWQFVGEGGINPEGVKKEINLVIDDGGELKTFQVEFIKRKTAFDLLKDKTEELNLTLKTKTYDIGILIEAIGDKENGQDGKYWLYYVNGKMPMVSADKKELKLGDKIEFKFEKSPF